MSSHGRISDVWDPYVLVESVMGYPRHREAYASSEASLYTRAHDTCLILSGLRELISDKRVCVVMPAYNLEALDPVIKGCDSLIAAETGSRIALEHGRRLDVIVTDLDAPLGLLLLYPIISRYRVIHVHGDNLERFKEYVTIENGNFILTSQVSPLDYSRVLGPFGYTDGDRAVLLPIVMGAREITVFGYEPHRPLAKPVFSGGKHIKIWLGLLLMHYYASIYGYRFSYHEGVMTFRKVSSMV